VIKTKYRVNNFGWWSKKSSYALGVGCLEIYYEGFDELRSLVHFNVKNGSKILSWHDV